MSTQAQSVDTGAKPLSADMRIMLYTASVLVFSVGISLFLLTEQTDRYFAWTIANPLTAAFFGAGYWASGALEFLSARERLWKNARIAVPSVLTFTTLMLIITLVHSDKFHFDAPRLITEAGTWFWLLVYVSVPLVMGLLFLRQGWSTGEPADTSAPLPVLSRSLFFLQAALMIPIGIALLIAPLTFDSVWPWALTDLTGRTVGAWLFAIGITAVQIAYENNARRVWAGIVSYAAFAGLQLIALARYTDRVDWDNPSAWVYSVGLAVMLANGAYLLLMNRQSGTVEAPATA